MKCNLVNIEAKEARDIKARNLISIYSDQWIEQICSTGNIDVALLDSVLIKQERQIRRRVYFFIHCVLCSLDLLEKYLCKTEIYRKKLDDLFFLQKNLYYPISKFDEAYKLQKRELAS